MQQIHTLETLKTKIRAEWVAVLVGLLLCTLVFFLWWTLEQREQINLNNKLTTEAIHLTTRVDTDMRNRIPALQRITQKWDTRKNISQNEFITEAQAYLTDTPGFQALEAVDKNLIVRWIVPLEDNKQALNLNLAHEQKRKTALEKARMTKSPTMTKPIDLVQGGKGFLIYFPIYSHEEFMGFLLAVFRIHEWLDYVFRLDEHNVSENFKISVFIDDELIFKQEGWDSLVKTALSATAMTRILDHRVSIHIRPTQLFIKQNKTILPKVTAVLGILMSGLIALVVYLLQKAYVETLTTNAAKIALEAETSAHAKAKEELQYTLSRLDMATKAGGIGVWIWDISTDMLTWNERMYTLYDIPDDVTPTYETWRNTVHPDDITATESLLKNAVAGKAVFNTEFRIVLSTGQIRYLTAAAKVERDHTGRPQRVTGINWDITDRKNAEEAFKQSEEQVRLLLNSTAEAIYGIDLQGNCTFANPACLKILEYADIQQVLGKNMHQLIHYSYSDGSPMRMEDCMIYLAFREGRQIHVDNEVLWKADGTSFPAEYWSYPQIVDNKICGAVVTFIDITERKRTEELLAAERSRLSSILEGTNVGTWEWHVQTGEVIFNERWAAMIGYTLEELAPVSIDTWIKFAHPDDLKVSNDLLEKHFRKESAYYECETRMRHKNGSWIWVLDRGKVATWTEDGKPLIMSGTHQEITGRKLAEEQIQHMATHDSLTNLPSLRLATDRLIMAIGIARRNQTMASVMFIDLDGFKLVNDTLGHDAGDFVLKEVALRLLSCVRETDTVARVGGDEFLFIASGLQTPQNAELIATKILRCLAEPIFYKDHQTAVGASIGISLFPQDSDNPEQLIKLADEAMYKVKNSGKNGYCLAAAAK